MHNLEDRFPPEPLFLVSFFPILKWQKETGRLVSAEKKKNEYNSWKTVNFFILKTKYVLWKWFNVYIFFIFVLLKDAIHPVVQDWDARIEYVFLDVQGMTNVGEENNARMEFVFLLEGPWSSGLSKEQSMRTLAGSKSPWSGSEA